MTDHSFSAEKAGSAEISTGESQDDEPLGKELDILKDLPSFNKDNFSRYTPCGGSLNKVSTFYFHHCLFILCW